MRRIGSESGPRRSITAPETGPEPSNPGSRVSWLPMSRPPSARSGWEQIVDYTRTVRDRQHVWVSGTDEPSAAQRRGVRPAYDQTVDALRRIDKALGASGASRQDVISTRFFVTRISDWKEILRAHGEFFGPAPPAATMVEVPQLEVPGLVVEVEAEAYVAPAVPPRRSTKGTRARRRK
jgi:enamine deaminase RidA (YjgF/YER057c/UK114 family)